MSKFNQGQRVRVVGHVDDANRWGLTLMPVGTVCAINEHGSAEHYGDYWSTNPGIAAHKFELVAETMTSESILDYLKERLEELAAHVDRRPPTVLCIDLIKQILTDCYGISAEIIPAQVRYS